jgi:hypothetical protein
LNHRRLAPIAPLALTLVVAVALAGAACRGAAPPLGELVEAAGGVEASAAKAPERWDGARVGMRFARGDGVRTGAGASARVRLRAGGVLRMGPGALVRFGADAGAGTEPSIQLEAGEAEIVAGSGEVIIETGSGRTRVRAGARARLTRADDGGIHVEVEVGAAMIEQGGAAPMEVTAGNQVDVRPGGAVGPNGGTSPPPASADAGPVATVTDDAGPVLDGGPPALAVELPGGTISVENQPALADVEVPVGEAAVIHDAGPPTHVRISFPSTCPGTALVEVKHGRTRTRLAGAGWVVASLGAGVHSYQVRCLEGPAQTPAKKASAAGTLRIVRDAGAARIKVTAPKNVVDADGRTWRILYQNKKPEVKFRWPRAPANPGATTLVIEDSRGRERRVAAKGAVATLRSGEIGEGSWRFWFVAEGGQRSAKTRLTLSFDNAAPVAQLTEPAGAPAWSADTVLVAGIATEGSQVSVDGVALPLDATLRFSSRVAVVAGRRAVAVRIAQGDRNVHYYVRRKP